MIDKKFFKKYQKQLVWFINTQIGRWFFCVDKDIQNIHEVLPNALSYNKCYLLKDGEWRKQQTTCFRTHNKYAKLINHRLRHFQRLGYLIPAFLKPELGMAMMLFMPLTVSTFRPDANPESTSVDGWASHNENTTTWSVLVNGAGSYFDDDAGSLSVYIAFNDPNWTSLARSIFLFDTSALPDDDTISAATLSLYGYNKDDTLSIAPDINIYSSNPASNTALANGDYDSLGSTAFSSVISYANWDTAGYNDFVLNSSGKSAISKTGISKFGGRNANYDVANSAPSTPGVNGSSKLYCYFAEQTGTDNDPKLVVTHTSLTHYDLVMETGAFTLTGKDVSFLASRKIVCETGSFILTGIDTIFTYGKRIVCETGNFVLTGNDATFRVARKIVCEAGSFILTGKDVAFRRGYKIVCGVGRFILTGIDVLLKRGIHNRAKVSTSFTNKSKNSTALTNKAKNSASFTNRSK